MGVLSLFALLTYRVDLLECRTFAAGKGGVVFRDSSLSQWRERRYLADLDCNFGGFVEFVRFRGFLLGVMPSFCLFSLFKERRGTGIKAGKRKAAWVLLFMYILLLRSWWATCCSDAEAYPLRLFIRP